MECNHHPDNGRLSEYSPYTFYEPDLGHVTGRGKITMDWFVHSFKPQIDRQYRTLPDRGHTFIAGSSMGGLMSLYALLEYNHVFSRAAALSPSLWVAPDRLAHLLIPQLGLAFLSSGGGFSPKPYRRIRLDGAAETDVLRRSRPRLRFARKVSAALVDEAVDSLAQAKAMHDVLEGIYNPHVSFDRVEEMACGIWEELQTFSRE